MNNSIPLEEDRSEIMKKGAKIRSNLFHREGVGFDYSNRNLKNSESLISIPSPRENSLIKNNYLTFQDHFIEPIFDLHRPKLPTNQSIFSPRIYFHQEKLSINETWRKGAFKIIILLVRFKNNLKEKTFTHYLKKMKNNQKDFIDDKTFFIDSYEEISRLLWEKKLEKFAYDTSLKTAGWRPKLLKPSVFKKNEIEQKKNCECMQRIITRGINFMVSILSLAYKLILILRPDLKTRIFWDIILIVIIITQMWYIPVFVSFEIAKESPSLNLYFQSVPFVIFSVDVLFNFVTGYYSKGLWVTEKKSFFFYFYLFIF